jgi:protoheme IX farnesyltransferase
VRFLSTFFSILKPGIIFGNLVTLSGGFFLASTGRFEWLLFFLTLISMSLIVGSGCVFNNVIDKDIDHLMKRTCGRVLVKGLVSTKTALWYGFFVGLFGFLILFFSTNLLTVFIAALGWFVYVVVYSLFFKRTSIWGTALGAISGAVPPVAGYCAVSGKFDLAAFVLFLILFFWQMPHFYAIAIYRLKDFKAANIPVLPAIKTMFHTKIEMLLYVVLYVISTLLLTYFGYAGKVYFVIAALLGLIWLFLVLRGFFIPNTSETEVVRKNSIWARRVFLFSIFEITVLSIAMLFH